MLPPPSLPDVSPLRRSLMLPPPSLPDVSPLRRSLMLPPPSLPDAPAGSPVAYAEGVMVLRFS